MKDYSKILIEKIVSTSRTVDKEQRNSNGSLEIKVSDNDIKDILGRKRLRQGLKDNLVNDLNSAGLKALNCDTDSLCITIPKEKIDKKILKYSDIKKD